jgi:uncharacterized protein (TIGR00730 family)
MKSIAIFCASSPGYDDIYMQSAYATGQIIAGKGIRLVYGGGQVGLMGAVANGALAEGGEVVGVIPHFLNRKEIGHKGVSELHVVESMHERKQMMIDLCDGVITLPGGFGTMEELFEMITWGQLGLHRKPIGLLNIEGFYDHLISFVNHMVEVGLLALESRNMLLISDDIEHLLSLMADYEAPQKSKWLTKEQN